MPGSRSRRGPGQNPRAEGLDWARRVELTSVLIASVVAVAGLWYSNLQTTEANAQARADRALVKEGQITDRYTAAVGNLGAKEMDVRLGGIYALERIMQDSHRDHPTIANVLATYIRLHAAARPPKNQDAPADVQAALTILGTRNTAYDKAFRPDLHGAHLNGAVLWGAHLRGAALYDADLSGAHLAGADLRGADMAGVKLRGANLMDAAVSGAHLAEADLSRADLGGVSLRGTYLKGADLSGADLYHANLRGAYLEGAHGVTKDQLDGTYTDAKTRLPTGVDGARTYSRPRTDDHLGLQLPGAEGILPKPACSRSTGTPSAHPVRTIPRDAGAPHSPRSAGHRPHSPRTPRPEARGLPPYVRLLVPGHRSGSGMVDERGLLVSASIRRWRPALITAVFSRLRVRRAASDGVGAIARIARASRASSRSRLSANASRIAG